MVYVAGENKTSSLENLQYLDRVNHNYSIFWSQFVPILAPLDGVVRFACGQPRRDVNEKASRALFQ